ncbi:putative Zinc carboxypeptidase A 1, partial [Daphnia magna]
LISIRIAIGGRIVLLTMNRRASVSMLTAIFRSVLPGSGSSSDPCSGTYHGIAAFSEREASAFRVKLVL